jgi:maltose O-acetyltransferase
MGDFAHRALDGLLNAAFVPVRLRVMVMRALGYGLGKDTALWSGACLMSKRISTGRGVFINVGFFYDGHEALRIGDNVRMGQFVRVITATHEIGPSGQRCRIEVSGAPVEIRDGAWIGAGAILLPGVTVERGCVIAAGSVVTRSTEPDGLYAGSPARLVRRLPAEGVEAVGRLHAAAAAQAPARRTSARGG